MPKQPKNQPNNSTHKLSAANANLLQYVQRHQQAIFSGILSTMAMDLGYNVTEATQFKLSAGLDEITITEQPDPPAANDIVKQA